jgi:hypothetical protein
MTPELDIQRANSARRLAVIGLLLVGVSLAGNTAIAQTFERSGPPPQSSQMPGGEGEMGPPGGEPPFQQIAKDLGLSTDQVRAAFRKVGPPGTPGQRPSEAQLRQHSQSLASALNVSPEKLRPVLEKYRPQPPARP